ncbi:hypothetical protein ACHWQZ_G009121 [Mnemiopsis leidyi]
MFELLVPNPVFSVHITAESGAVVTTDRGEVVRWSRVDQTQRYTVQHSTISDTVVDTTLHNDGSSLLLLDASHNVWVSDNTGLSQLNPSSALGGLSRRVSSMFWTAPETQLGDPIKIVSCNDVIFLVGSKGVQRIHGTAITWTTELKPLVSNSCNSLLIIDAVSDRGELKCLVQVDEMLFVVALSSQHTAVPCSVDTSIQLQTDGVGKVKLFLQPGTDVGILYSHSQCHILTLATGVTIPVEVDAGEVICAVLSAGDINLLTKQNGLVKLLVKDVKAAVSNLNISASDGDEYKTVEKKFLGAFKCFLEFNETQEQATLQAILGTEDTDIINKLLSDTGDYLISAAPAADPRWGGSDANLPVTLGLQIDERIRRLKGLLQFVVATGYYDNIVSQENNIAIRLMQFVEKCLVAKMLCSSNCALLRRAINEAAALFKSGESQISSEDIVFSNIKKIEVVYGALAEGQNTVLSSKTESEAVIQDLFSSVEVIQQTFDAVLSWRDQSHQLYNLALKSDTLTWCDTDEIRTMLTAQVHIALETVLNEVDEDGRYQVILVSASLVESVLKLYQGLIERLPPSDNRTANLQTEFERRRDTLIRPFVELKIHQIAFTLAEQFKHFTLLVQLCEETNDMAKLRSLSAAHVGFAEVAYNWYLAQGKESRLLTANVADPKQLSKFLTSQPHLKWIHQLGNKDYSTAGETLAKLGMEEKELLSRKKTLLSISKLSFLADGQEPDSENIRNINRQLETVTHQERMKPEVIENAGLLPDKMAPISCPDLIRLCVGDYNKSLEDIDVKKALDLLQCAAEDEDVSNEQFEKLRLEIWCAVIQRDDWWTRCHLVTPDQIEQTLFYRAVILAYNSGMLVAHFLPTVDQLLSQDSWTQHFSDERQMKQFEYILRSGYEQMSSMGLSLAR